MLAQGLGHQLGFACDDGFSRHGRCYFLGQPHSGPHLQSSPQVQDSPQQHPPWAGRSPVQAQFLQSLQGHEVLLLGMVFSFGNHVGGFPEDISSAGPSQTQAHFTIGGDQNRKTATLVTNSKFGDGRMMGCPLV